MYHNRCRSARCRRELFNSRNSKRPDHYRRLSNGPVSADIKTLSAHIPVQGVKSEWNSTPESTRTSKVPAEMFWSDSNRSSQLALCAFFVFGFVCAPRAQAQS